jgi:hypothetical protein
VATCPSCQSSMSDDADFCGHCGSRLAVTGEAPPEAREGPSAEAGEATPEEIDAYRQLVLWVATKLRQGEPSTSVINALEEAGWDRTQATVFVWRVQGNLGGSAEWDPEKAEEATKHFAFSILASLIGAGLTYGTYSGAEAGGSYYIFYGAVAYGGLRLLQGTANFFLAPNALNALLGLIALGSLGVGIAAIVYGVGGS